MGVSQSMVVVEHHDGGDHAGGHHEHDAVEVCACGLDKLRLGLVWVWKCKKKAWAAILLWYREIFLYSFKKVF